MYIHRLVLEIVVSWYNGCVQETYSIAICFGFPWHDLTQLLTQAHKKLDGPFYQDPVLYNEEGLSKIQKCGICMNMYIYIYIRIHQCIFKGGILTSWNSSWRSHIFSQVGARARLRIPSANRRSLQNWKLAPWFHDVPRHVRTKFWEFVWDGFEESVGNSSGVWILSPKVGWCETLWNILKHCETLWNSGTFNNPCSL